MQRRNNDIIYHTCDELHSFAPRRCGCNHKLLIFQLKSRTDIWSISCLIALWWMPPDLTDDYLTAVLVMEWCLQAMSHYLNQQWASSLTPYGITMSQLYITPEMHLMIIYCAHVFVIYHNMMLWCISCIFFLNEGWGYHGIFIISVRWCCNIMVTSYCAYGVSNPQSHDCLLNCLFRRRSKKTPKLPLTGLYEGNSPVTSEFPAQKASNSENVGIWWYHYEQAF